MRCAGECNGSPTYACQESCEKENHCRSQDTSRAAEETEESDE